MGTYCAQSAAARTLKYDVHSAITRTETRLSTLVMPRALSLSLSRLVRRTMTLHLTFRTPFSPPPRRSLSLSLPCAALDLSSCLFLCIVLSDRRCREVFRNAQSVAPVSESRPLFQRPCRSIYIKGQSFRRGAKVFRATPSALVYANFNGLMAGDNE